MGRVSAHGNGWRVGASVDSRHIHGPYRARKGDADEDLKRARTAKSREEFASILRKLYKVTPTEVSSENDHHAQPEVQSFAKYVCDSAKPLMKGARLMQCNMNNGECKDIPLQREISSDTFRR